MFLHLKKFELPFSVEVLHRIEAILREKRVFGFFDQTIDPYDLTVFIQERFAHNTQTVALFDQNVLNDSIEPARILIDAETRPCSDRGRLGAALMAFLQAGNILVEPTFAIHEKGPFAHRDLQIFRAADNVDPAIYARIALGELDQLPAGALPQLGEPETKCDFSKPIKGRSVLRLALLKIACLELSQLSKKEKMAEFIRWSFEDFCFARIPMLLACSYLSPKRQNPMLKKIQSKDRMLAMRSIENALWDVQLLQDWAKRVTEQKRRNCLYLLCSGDIAVQNIASVLCRADASPGEIQGVVTDFFIKHWGDRDGKSLADYLHLCEKRKDDRRRFFHKDRSATRLALMAKNLESELMEWQLSK